MSERIFPRQSWQTIAGYLKRLFLFDIGLLTLIAIFDYLMGWRTLFVYADSLFILGGLVITLGTLASLGHWGQTRSYPYQFSSSVGDADLPARTDRELQDLEQSYSFSTLMIFAGFSLALISIGLHQLIK